MTSLDANYIELMHVGFSVLRQAVDSGDREWVDAELEMLHNIPSLVGENNLERHRYYWLEERTHYIDWVSKPGRENALSRMRTYYEPTWHEMAATMEELCMQLAGDAKRA